MLHLIIAELMATLETLKDKVYRAETKRQMETRLHELEEKYKNGMVNLEEQKKECHGNNLQNLRHYHVDSLVCTPEKDIRQNRRP